MTLSRETFTDSATLRVFGDITDHQFIDAILWLAESGITVGCSREPLQYCPSRPVTRAQMASFLARALDLEAPEQPAGFADVDPSGGHAANIEALFAAEITTGCTRVPLKYCPSRPVTRAQMASFLARALDLEAPEQPAGFADVDPSGGHAANIEALFAAEITTGCTRVPLKYCPSRPVTRAQMASFLARALDLEAPEQPAGFADVDPSGGHAANIEALFAAEITTGCTRVPLKYCPDRPITRAQMAAFLYRARDLITAARGSS